MYSWITALRMAVLRSSNIAEGILLRPPLCQIRALTRRAAFGVGGGPLRVQRHGPPSARRMFSPTGRRIRSASVVPLLLRRRIEHTKVWRCIGARAGSPLPAVIVGRNVAVEQVLHEPPRTPLPRQVQILDEKARHDHADSVVHPARREELTQTSINDAKTGLACRPLIEAAACGGVGVDGHCVESGLRFSRRCGAG